MSASTNVGAGCLVTGVRWVGAVLLGVLLVISLFGTLATASSLSPWTIVWLALTLGLAWAFVRVGRRAVRVFAGGAWDAEITAAIAQLPPGTRVHRSEARTESPAAWLAGAVLVAGLLGGCTALYVGTDEEGTTGAYESLALACVALGGFMAGGLFAIARDSRGRRAGLIGALTIPLLLAGWMLFASDVEVSFGERLLTTFGTLVVTGLPVVIGFGVTRLVFELRRRSRGTVLALGASTDTRDPELVGMTANGGASAIRREYRPDATGEADLREDERQLTEAGYVEVAVCRDPPDLWGNHSGRVAVLFVQAALARTMHRQVAGDDVRSAG